MRIRNPGQNNHKNHKFPCLVTDPDNCYSGIHADSKVDDRKSDKPGKNSSIIPFLLLWQPSPERVGPLIVLLQTFQHRFLLAGQPVALVDASLCPGLDLLHVAV